MAGFTVIFTEEEFCITHPVPLCTTALNHVSAVRLPMSAELSVVVVLLMSAGDVNNASLELCHFTTPPVLPLRVRLAGMVL